MEYEDPSGRRLRIGVHTPVVVQTPGGHARWEEGAEVEDLRAVAEAADRLGYNHLTCSEHIGIPVGDAGRRGGVYWDPLATLSWVAAVTTRIRLATNVLVLGYHHPAELLKRYGTLDRLSGGRVILGVGVGSLEAEFDLLGAPFANRGERADEALRVLADGWGRPTVEYHGTHFDFGPIRIEPHSARSSVPVWVGGRTRRSLRRAVELGQGWTPFGISHPAIADMLDSFDLPAGFDVVLSVERPLDPARDPDVARRLLDDLASAGATVVHASFVHSSLDDYLEQLEVLARLVATG